MSDAAKITREDRLAAYQATRGIGEPPLGSRARQWVDLGIGDYRDWERVAQAIADVRTSTASAKDVVVEATRKLLIASEAGVDHFAIGKMFHELVVPALATLDRTAQVER